MGHNWVHKGSYVNKLFGGALYTKTSTQNIVAQEDLELSQKTYLPQQAILQERSVDAHNHRQIWAPYWDPGEYGMLGEHRGQT